MTIEKKDSHENNDFVFDKIMKIYFVKQQDKLSWPAEEVILKYLANKASEKEIEQIQDAMIDSEMFMELIINLQSAESKPNENMPEEEISTISTPEMSRVKSIIENKSLKVDTQQNKYDNKFSFSTRFLIPLAAAAVIAFFFIPKYLNFADPIEIKFSKYDIMLNSAFENNPHMGRNEEVFYNSQDAAYSMFSSALNREDDKWTLVNKIQDNYKSLYNKTISLTFSEEKGKVGEEVNLLLPNDVWSNSNKQIEIWLMSFPSLTVGKAKLINDNLSTTWSNIETDSLFLMTITFSIDSTWQVLPASVFKIKK